MKAKKVNLITLCGFMGAGKTSVGEILANLLDYTFVDLDEKIEHQAGCSIRKMFEQRGEAFFRKKERAAINKIMKNDKYVIALGGGALQNQAIVEAVKEKSLLVFIECPLSVILERILADKKRPLLLKEDGTLKKKEVLKDEFETLYQKRLPLYQQASIAINSSDYPSPQEAAEELHFKLSTYGR